MIKILLAIQSAHPSVIFALARMIWWVRHGVNHVVEKSVELG